MEDDKGSPKIPEEELAPMSDPFSEATIERVLSVDHEKGLISPNETDKIELKEAWNGGHISEYARSMAAFANNKGGYLVFGVKDGSGEIVGLTTNKFAEYDAARLSERVHNLVQPQLEWDKRIVEICTQRVGLLYVAESRQKPIIGTKNDGRISDGAIYFRYPGETRQIRHVDLINLIRERERQLLATFSEKIARIAEVGPYDAAILNAREGTLELSGRPLHLDEPLRHEVLHLASSEHGADDGVLRLSGTISGGTRPPTVVRGNVSDYDVLNVFVDRIQVSNPFDYIRHFLDTQTIWLPLFWYVLLYGKPISHVLTELNELPKLKPKSWEKLVERLEGGRSKKSTYLCEGLQKVFDRGKSVEFRDSCQAIDTMRAMTAIKFTENNEAAVFRTLDNALRLFDAEREKRLFDEIRYAASFVDQQLYRSRCQALGD